MGYAKKWKDHRKMFLKHFQPAVVPRYHSEFAKEAKILLGRLVTEPNDFIIYACAYMFRLKTLAKYLIIIV